MSRLPFDSSTPPATSRGRRGDAPLSVSEVSALIKRTLADALPARLRIVGQVSNLSDRTHWFFSLKDGTCAIRCVCFASAAARVRFRVRDGMEVVVTGRVDYYEAQGNLQIYVDAIEPVGEGALELQFRALCEELRRLGYFDIERKKPLPAVPRALAVVTSAQGAALQDVINTAARRWSGCRLYLIDVRVQGEQAAPQIARALKALSREGARFGIDAIILTRGGGSIEDLWAFNERIVADAVFECALPVVAAIGHETDTTIAELVADERCATPTQAAMRLIPDRAALEHQVHQMQSRLAMMLRRSLEHAKHRVAAVERHPVFRHPQRMLIQQRGRVDELDRRLRVEIARRFKAAQERLTATARHLEVVGPRSVLERGYSYTMDAAGRVLRHAADAAAGDRISTVLAEGKLTSEVIGASGASQVPRPPSAKRASGSNRKPPPSAAVPPGLFD